MLPRIKVRNPYMRKETSEAKKDWQIIEELKKMRNRSLSNAGRKKE